MEETAVLNGGSASVVNAIISCNYERTWFSLYNFWTIKLGLERGIPSGWVHGPAVSRGQTVLKE